MVRGEGLRHHAGSAHQPPARFEAGDAAIGGGAADRARRVAADRERGEPGGERRSGTARGAGGDALGVPGVAGAAVQVPGRGAEGELVGVDLAEEDGTGGRETGRDGGVRFRHPVRQDVGAGGGADAVGLHDVLEAEGDAVQRPAPAPGRDLAIGGLGLGQGPLGGHGDVGLDLCFWLVQITRTTPRRRTTFALGANSFHRRSDFHDRPTPTILPRVRSRGDSFSLTLSPTSTRMKFRPARLARAPSPAAAVRSPPDTTRSAVPRRPCRARSHQMLPADRPRSGLSCIAGSGRVSGRGPPRASGRADRPSSPRRYARNAPTDFRHG